MISDSYLRKTENEIEMGLHEDHRWATSLDLADPEENSYKLVIDSAKFSKKLLDATWSDLKDIAGEGLSDPNKFKISLSLQSWSYGDLDDLEQYNLNHQTISLEYTEYNCLNLENHLSVTSNDQRYNVGITWFKHKESVSTDSNVLTVFLDSNENKHSIETKMDIDRNTVDSFNYGSQFVDIDEAGKIQMESYVGIKAKHLDNVLEASGWAFKALSFYQIGSNIYTAIKEGDEVEILKSTIDLSIEGVGLALDIGEKLMTIGGKELFKVASGIFKRAGFALEVITYGVDIYFAIQDVDNADNILKRRYHMWQLNMIIVGGAIGLILAAVALFVPIVGLVVALLTCVYFLTAMIMYMPFPGSEIAFSVMMKGPFHAIT